MKEFLQKAKESSRVVATLSTAIKNKTLLEFADALEENSCFIIEENIKDMKLADEEAKESDITLNVLETVLRNYQELEKEGYGDLGTQALMKYYKKP